jgi:competence protein ComEA
MDRRATVGLLVLMLLTVGYGVQHFWIGRPQRVSVPVSVAPVSALALSSDPASGPGSASAAAKDPADATGPAVRPGASPTPTVVVDISGKVRHPGLRTLPRGSRVADALRAAGGLRAGADSTGLNLARMVADGEQILVGVPGLPSAAGPRPTQGDPGPVSLNTATVEQLDALPGVGPVLARHIVEYRDAHTGFASVDQLRQVSGIGDRKYADIAPLVVL